MKLKVLFPLILSILVVLVSGVHAAVEVTNLKCEYKINPRAIDVKNPRLSWQILSEQRDVRQIAYEIRAANSLKELKSGKKLLWETGRVDSENSIHVVYNGPELTSRQIVFWQVRVWDNKGKSSGWSDYAFWEMGLLDKSEWKAQWIQPNFKEDEKKSNPCPMLRQDFRITGEVESARVYITALGLYKIEINSKKVGDEVFTPGWTAYDSRLQYQTFDISGHLLDGDNAVGVTLGDGWYRGNLAWSGNRNVYGKSLVLLAQIEITLKDGSRQTVISDDTWKCSTGPILMSDIYNGEVYDARLEKEDWSAPGFDDSEWSGVTVIDKSKDILVAPAGVPVKKIEEIKPVKIIKTPKGETVIDMGQNMVGWVRLWVSGLPGTVVTLRHAEVLDKEGNFYTENLRSADQTIKYTLKGADEEIYEPSFTFQGFRYVAIDGYPGDLTLDSVTGIVIHSDIAPAGSFLCSNDMVNQLQHNIKWGQKGNFLDVPTDCPQRDERLGWTGDAQVFARTACFNHDVAAFYTKWLKDVAADQKASGTVPNVLPNIFEKDEKEGGGSSAGWADAAVIIPWTMYLCYGDSKILQEQYSSMKGWVDYMAHRAGDSYFWNTDFTFGDWLAFATDRSDYPGATTDKDLICQAYFARSTDIVQRTAVLLGKDKDSEKYAELLKKIKKVFNEEFVTPNGRLSSNTQTAYSLALAFDLLPESKRKSAAQRLADDVNKFKHITTGFLGTPVICHVLSDWNYYEEAFMLLNRKEYPSWLYPITQGATTIWERWDGLKPDGNFQNKGMNSFNHYAYGAIGEWLYRIVAGIEIDENNPGYKHVIFQPHPGGGLEFASANINSMYGIVACEWKKGNGKMIVNIELPANTTATVHLPKAQLDMIKEGTKALSKVKEVTQTAQDGENVVLYIGSGKYSFSYPVK